MRSVVHGRVAIAALAFLFASLLPVGASPWAEAGGGQLRADLELLQAAGVIHDLTVQWPLPWQSLMAELDRADLAAEPASVRAAAQRLHGQAQLSFEHNGEVFSGRVSLGAITNNFGSKPNKIMPDGSYLSLRLWDVRLYAGYLDHWWGPGEITALQLSNNARPMPQIGFARAETAPSSWPVLNWLGPWQFEFFLGRMDGPQIQ